MLLKKIAISAVAGAVMLSTAAGVFAEGFTGNWAHMHTYVNSSSNTGGNLIGVGGNSYYQNGSMQNGGNNGNGQADNSYIHTGNATTKTFVLQATNTNLGGGHETINGAHTHTYVNSQSNTGNNVMGGGGNTYYQNTNMGNGGNNGNGTANYSYTTTGNAYTHTAVVNVVNTNLRMMP